MPAETSTAATLSLADDCLAFSAGGDAVLVAFEDFLRDPSNDGGIVTALKLLLKLRFKFLDVRHGREMIGS